MESLPVLEVNHFSASFNQYQQTLYQGEQEVVNDLNLSLYKGEILAVVGASGSGKSILAHGILGILPKNANTRGQLLYHGVPLNQERQRTCRGKGIALIPQSVAYLDPLLKVKDQVMGLKKGPEAEAQMARIFSRLGLDLAAGEAYPYQLSGGMARRVLFSTALMGQPDLIIADEPTPGMGVEQATVALGILREMADQGAAVLLITHDVDLALSVADRLTIFYEGTTVETTSVRQFELGPDYLTHDFSKALWRAMPQHEFIGKDGGRPPLGGSV